MTLKVLQTCSVTGGGLVEMGITCTCGCQFVRSCRVMFCYIQMAVAVHMTAMERLGSDDSTVFVFVHCQRLFDYMNLYWVGVCEGFKTWKPPLTVDFELVCARVEYIAGG